MRSSQCVTLSLLEGGGDQTGLHATLLPSGQLITICHIYVFVIRESL